MAGHVVRGSTKPIEASFLVARRLVAAPDGTVVARSGEKVSAGVFLHRDVFRVCAVGGEMNAPAS